MAAAVVLVVAVLFVVPLLSVVVGPLPPVGRLKQATEIRTYKRERAGSVLVSSQRG
jgi:hypothetical protein